MDTQTTTRYLMTDHDAGTAYVQDWTDDDGDVLDVTEVENLDLGDLDTVGVVIDAAAVAAARAAGYRVADQPAGDNGDLGSAYIIG